MNLLRTNREKLVKISVIGEVVSAVMKPAIYRVSAEGVPVILPMTGGITYNVRVGDPVCGWMGDHVEPGVSLENRVKDSRMPEAQSRALNVLSCIGNEAKIVTGDAKEKTGTVVGKHGGIEHVMVDFAPEILEQLVIEDRVQIKAYGVGLQLLDIPEVKALNLDPTFLDAINPKIVEGRLEVPVTHKVPAAIMGSGLGSSHMASGDYDITLFDKTIVTEYGLDDLCLGDLVALIDADVSYGPIYRTGAITVGIVTHINCNEAGHGPGVTTLFTSKTGKIRPVIDENANIARILDLRDDL